MNYSIIAMLLLVVITSSFLYVTPKSFHLERRLNAFNLTDKWLPGYNVGCMDGEIRPDGSTHVKTSHCSCFVAAVCDSMKRTMIDAREYGQYNLSTKQIEWLQDEGMNNGWKQITGSLEEKFKKSYDKAHNGHLVVVGVKQTEKTNGHIAIVRPDVKWYNDLCENGPNVITSSHVNSYSVSLKDDFMLHQKDFQFLEAHLRFFYHKTAISE